MGDFEKKKSNIIQPIQPISRIKSSNREKTAKEEKDKENKKNDYLAVLEKEEQKQQQQRQEEEEQRTKNRQTNTSIEHLQRDFRKQVRINGTEEKLKSTKAQEAYKKQEKYEER